MTTFYLIEQLSIIYQEEGEVGREWQSKFKDYVIPLNAKDAETESE